MFSGKQNEMPLPAELESYRLRSRHSNDCYKIPVGGKTLFLKIYRPKKPAVTYAFRRFLGIAGFRQPVEYTSPGQRRSFEEGALKHWKECGYHVPDIMENPFPELSGLPVLVTRFIEGPTLQGLARDFSRSVKEKNAALLTLFREVAARHERALRRMDMLLFHIDANTRNILFAEDVAYHVDFEMGRPWESPVRAASREVLKLLVTLAEDLDPVFRAPVIKAFRECYPHRDVLQSIRSGIVDRPFQSFHRFNNEQKKKRDPGRVTLYELMDYLF